MFRRTLGQLSLLVVLAGLRCSAGPLAPAGFLQDIDFIGKSALFGGFSALQITPDGLSFTAQSDHGAYVSGQFTRDDAGHVTAIQTGTMNLLLGHDGRPLRPGMTDSEGLAIAKDGTAFVAFEGPARIWRYTKLGSAAEILPSHPAFARMLHNTALESIALAPDGALYTVPELPAAPGLPFPVFRYRHGTWDQPFSFPAIGGFMVSDATFGPDGRFYVLEREFHGLGGFATRIRRFDLTETGLLHEKTVLQTDPGTHDNLEGLAIWRDAKGLRATMVSDNNFLPLFRSEIVEYRLPD